MQGFCLVLAEIVENANFFVDFQLVLTKKALKPAFFFAFSRFCATKHEFSCYCRGLDQCLGEGSELGFTRQAHQQAMQEPKTPLLCYY